MTQVDSHLVSAPATGVATELCQVMKSLGEILADAEANKLDVCILWSSLRNEVLKTFEIANDGVSLLDAFAKVLSPTNTEIRILFWSVRKTNEVVPTSFRRNLLERHTGDAGKWSRLQISHVQRPPTTEANADEDPYSVPFFVLAHAKSQPPWRLQVMPHDNEEVGDSPWIPATVLTDHDPETKSKVRTEVTRYLKVFNRLWSEASAKPAKAKAKAKVMRRGRARAARQRPATA